MRITRLELTNYRNYSSACVQPAAGVTVLAGDNAQGKTNVLEAIYLTCTGRSHRTSKDRELVKAGAEFAKVSIQAERIDGCHDVEISLFPNERRRVKVAGFPVSRSGEMLGHITGVLFSPEDLRMVKDGPAERRRFVDMELSQIRPAYYYALQKYNRSLKQRNTLLREMVHKPALGATLEMWDQQLAEAGEIIMDMRSSFIARLNAEAARMHDHVSGGAEKLNVEYAPNAPGTRDGFLRALLDARQVDQRRMTTTVGPHRDDVRLMLNGQDARAFGSQGQQRTTALSLKLSEMAVMREATGEWPVLMLDDVMSELDPGRRRLLVSLMEDVQTLITCTDETDLAGAAVGKTIFVHAAHLSEKGAAE